MLDTYFASQIVLSKFVFTFIACEKSLDNWLRLMSFKAIRKTFGVGAFLSLNLHP